jgi:hypothetical protein
MNFHGSRNILASEMIITSIDVFLKWFDYNNMVCLLNDETVNKLMQEFNEHFVINGEELITANYLLHYKNLDKIKFVDYTNYNQD